MFRDKATGEAIEAVQVTGADPFDAIERLVGGDCEFRDGLFVVATRQGALRAEREDWIVKLADGTFRSCKPSRFAEMYEPTP